MPYRNQVCITARSSGRLVFIGTLNLQLKSLGQGNSMFVFSVWVQLQAASQVHLAQFSATGYDIKKKGALWT